MWTYVGQGTPRINYTGLCQDLIAEWVLGIASIKSSFDRIIFFVVKEKDI